MLDCVGRAENLDRQVWLSNTCHPLDKQADLTHTMSMFLLWKSLSTQ